MLRLTDVKRACKKQNIEVIAGEYDINAWFEIAKGLENEPEKGERCLKCFEFRMEKTFEIAKNLGQNLVTTTLLMSPKKSYDQLVTAMSEMKEKFGIDFIAPDFRKNGGTQAQFELAKNDKLYHQNYCGCIYGLKNSRNSEIYELTSPIGGEILPNSIEEKLEIYTQILDFSDSQKYEILRDKFMNYRLLWAKVMRDDEIIPSFWLYGSHFKRNLARFGVDEICDKFFSQKEEIKLLSLKFFNENFGFDYKSTKEIIFDPPSVTMQQNIRQNLTKNLGFSPIVIIDEIKKAKYFFEAKSDIFLDVREILVTI